EQLADRRVLDHGLAAHPPVSRLLHERREVASAAVTFEGEELLGLVRNDQQVRNLQLTNQVEPPSNRLGGALGEGVDVYRQVELTGVELRAHVVECDDPRWRRATTGVQVVLADEGRLGNCVDAAVVLELR